MNTFWGKSDPSTVSPLATLLTVISLSDVGNEENAADMIRSMKGSGHIPPQILPNPCVLLAQAKALFIRQQDPQIDSDRGALSRMFLNEPRLDAQNKALACTKSEVMQKCCMLPRPVGETRHEYHNTPASGFRGASICTKSNTTWEEVERTRIGLMGRWAEQQQETAMRERINRTPVGRQPTAATLT